MKKMCLLILLFLVTSIPANAHTITGKIGQYPIEMEINSVNRETGALLGRYRYANKERYLKLNGEVLNSIVWMEESYKNEVTGTFYLEFLQNQLIGKWISGETWYEVVLNITDKTHEKCDTKSLEEYAKDVSSSISGGYATESYFLNDMWFSKEKPQMEIGFNGGALVLEHLPNDSLRFWVNTICGPTYHIAYASGIAHRTGTNSFTYLVDAYEGDTCIVTIELGKKSVEMKAEGNFVCGFGARAYLDHSFIKITDRYEFEEEEVSIGEMKRSQ